MKKSITYLKLWLPCLLLNLSIPAAAHPIRENQPDIRINQLARFIKIWGLIKYRSTVSAEGKFNADSVFLQYYPLVKHANALQFNSLMLTLTENYVSMRVAKTGFHTVANGNRPRLTLNIDHTWINDPALGFLLRKKLKKLVNTYNPGSKHYYMNNVYYEGDLPNEQAYPGYGFMDETMNFLSLAKAWNAVNYLFPYKYQTDINWNTVLTNMIPVFEQINSKASYETALLALETATCDTHASGFLEEINTRVVLKLAWYPPFDYQVDRQQIVVGEPLNDSLAKTSQLKPGDRIVMIDGVAIDRWLKERAQLLPASNASVKARLLSPDLQGAAYAFGDLKNGEPLVTLRRGKRLIREKIKMLSARSASDVQLINNYLKAKQAAERATKGQQDLGEGIGLIRAGYFSEADLPNTAADSIVFERNLRDKQVLIFDMRKYPKSPGLFFTYIPRALGKPAFRFARYYGADIHDPGNFLYNDQIDVYLSPGLKTNAKLYPGRIVILVNEHTQSMGEWFTMMLSQLNGRATIIGSQTAGADGDLKYLTLPGGYRFKFTGNGIFYPDGRKTQRIGIKPDIYFKPDPEDSAAADPLLQKAIDLIRTETMPTIKKKK